MRHRALGGRLAGPRGLLLLLVVAAARAIAQPAAWTEGFDQGRLDPARWQVTADGDFRERVVDVVDVAGPGGGDFRLRLRADTRGTRDDTVKYLGVRSMQAARLDGGARVSVELDWNEQANGSYLSAALILAPSASPANPLVGPDWIKVEYVGVPPGRNARLVVAARVGGRERILHAEGWPDTNRTGRRIARQRLALVTHGGTLELWENGRRVVGSSPGAFAFDTAFLYLQMSSHSNYPARELYFDEIRVGPGP